MNIVVEGPDGSGKSTLVAELARVMSLPVVRSAGPPSDIGARVRDHLARQNTIFDRHVCVSQSVYGHIRGEIFPRVYLKDFREQNPLLIYCRPRIGVHVVKAHDTADHLAMIENQKEKIAFLYRDWAFANAHIFHRTIGRTIALVRGVWTYE